MNEDHPPSVDQETDEQTQDAPQCPKKRSGKRKWLLLLLLILVLGILGWWYLPAIKQKIQTPQPQAVSHAPKTQERESLQHILKSHSSRIAALEKARATPPVQRGIPKLDLASLPDFQPLLVALRRLEQLTRTTKPFRNELDDVFAQIPTLPAALGPDLEKLLTLADTGVPTAEQLAKEFDATTSMPKQPTAEQPAPKKSTTQNWISRSKNWAKSLVFIRYTSFPQKQQQQTKSTSTRIGELLTQGNLAAILEHKTYLEGYQNPKMQEWYQHLQDRILVQQMITEIKSLSLIIFIFGTIVQEPQQENEE